MRIIRVHSCDTCPSKFKDYSTGAQWAKPGTGFCEKTRVKDDSATCHAITRMRLLPLKGIPEWCPLEKCTCHPS